VIPLFFASPIPGRTSARRHQDEQPGEEGRAAKHEAEPTCLGVGGVVFLGASALVAGALGSRGRSSRRGQHLRKAAFNPVEQKPAGVPRA